MLAAPVPLSSKMKRAFTLVEMLVVIAIIAVLAALLLPVLGKARGAARKTVCISNARQINLGLQLYVAEHGDALRALTNDAPIYYSYRDSIRPYLARTGAATNDPLFICPADDFNCDAQPMKDIFAFDQVGGRGIFRQAATQFNSYFFNGMVKSDDPGNTHLAQKPFASVREPTRAILAGEISGGFGLSAHDRRQPWQFNNAMTVMSFVDGHVGYIRIYWNGTNGLAGIPFLYPPPAGYDYKWTAD